MPIRRRHTAILLQGIGYAVLLIGVFGDGFDWSDIRTLGSVMSLGCVTWILMSRTRRDEDDVYEAGRQSGYNCGFRDGRQVQRPVVVALEDRRAMRRPS